MIGPASGDDTWGENPFLSLRPSLPGFPNRTRRVTCTGQTPYIDEINTAEAEFLTTKEFEIIDIQGLNLTKGIEFGQLTPAYIKAFALEIDHPDAEAIFLSCSGIRAIEVIQEIEDATGKPVITSNQAQMWSCLRRAGIDDEIKGYGQIFELPG